MEITGEKDAPRTPFNVTAKVDSNQTTAGRTHLSGTKLRVFTDASKHKVELGAQSCDSS